jgi:hypothetical protein
MVNWETGKPNARFRVLELLKHNFGPGDRLVSTQVASPDVAAQAYRTSTGRKLLLVNKSVAPVSVNLPPEDAGARMDVVDTVTGENPPQSSTVSGTQVTLSPFAVAVVFTPNP